MDWSSTDGGRNSSTTWSKFGDKGTLKLTSPLKVWNKPTQIASKRKKVNFFFSINLQTVMDVSGSVEQTLSPPPHTSNSGLQSVSGSLRQTSGWRHVFQIPGDFFQFVHVMKDLSLSRKQRLPRNNASVILNQQLVITRPRNLRIFDKFQAGRWYTETCTSPRLPPLIKYCISSFRSSLLGRV